MARWEGDAKGRLARAALDLFAQHGYDATTVADIVERAGLTRSTFFRHFDDKREVLFTGQSELVASLTHAVRSAPPDAKPSTCLTALLIAMAEQFPPEALALAATRASVIDAHPELRERDLLKRAHLGAALEDALSTRVADAITARLLATLAMLAFDTALSRWASDARGEEFSTLLRTAGNQLIDKATALDSSTTAEEPRGRG
jgi:AcrR family transcriptional regulator